MHSLGCLLAVGTAFAALVSATPSLNSRSSSEIGELYAYGTNLSGLPLFYLDGAALLGDSSLANGSVQVNFTLSDTTLAVSATLGNETSIGSPVLAIDTDSSSNEVLLSNGTLESGYTSSGFLFYGSQVAWKDSNGTLESSFYATPSNTTGIWLLEWAGSSGSTNSEATVIVNLKNLPPP